MEKAQTTHLYQQLSIDKSACLTFLSWSRLWRVWPSSYVVLIGIVTGARNSHRATIYTKCVTRVTS